MIERLRSKDVLTKPKAVLAVFLASVAFAGCGNTRSSNTEPIGACGVHDYSKAEYSHPNETVSEALATARGDVLTLQMRALRAAGSIDLSRYNGDTGTTEITASSGNLELNFARDDGAGLAVDHINFPIKGNSVQISEGAIMCLGNNDQLTVNGTFTALRQYVHQTAILDK